MNDGRGHGMADEQARKFRMEQGFSTRKIGGSGEPDRPTQWPIRRQRHLWIAPKVNRWLARRGHPFVVRRAITHLCIK